MRIATVADVQAMADYWNAHFAAIQEWVPNAGPLTLNAMQAYVDGLTIFGEAEGICAAVAGG